MLPTGTALALEAMRIMADHADKRTGHEDVAESNDLMAIGDSCTQGWLQEFGRTNGNTFQPYQPFASADYDEEEINGMDEEGYEE